MMDHDEMVLNKQVVVESYERHGPEIFHYARRRLKDHELAEACVAEIFCRFLIAARAGTPFENPRAYLYRVAHNWITDQRRPPASASLEDNLQLDREGNLFEVAEALGKTVEATRALQHRAIKSLRQTLIE